MPNKYTYDETDFVTSGFFNGQKNTDGTIDRLYNADDISSMFDGLITDGIFASIGGKFECSIETSAVDSLVVKVATGKAWFDKTWIINNSTLKITLDPADSARDRIDAIVIDIDKEKRKNTIQYIPGTPSDDPKEPTLATAEDSPHKQYALCWIRVNHETTNSNDLTFHKNGRVANFITAPLSTIDSKPFLEGWTDTFQGLYNDQQEELVKALETLGKTSEERVNTEITTWKERQQASFDDWFGKLNTTLTAEAAANLNTKLNREKINRLLQNGFEQCTKKISEDGKTITSRNSAGDIDPDSNEYYKIEKAFNDDFSKLITTLSDNNNVTKAIMTKTFDSTGSTIETIIDYKQV